MSEFYQNLSHSRWHCKSYDGVYIISNLARAFEGMSPQMSPLVSMHKCRNREAAVLRLGVPACATRFGRSRPPAAND